MQQDFDRLSMFLSLISWEKNGLKVISVILFHCAIIVIAVDGLFVDSLSL